MSSIAYITDHEMIEYHRLHGSTELVFWRPTSQKKFAHFHHGDYLFFLSKGTEKGKGREKGIVGYGRYIGNDSISIRQVWKKYQNKTGYGSERQFLEAIKHVSKGEKLPKKMHCLLLEHVLFFQAPIYLSETNISISKQIESYIYLDQVAYDTSWRILQQAEKVGLDMWSNLVEKRTFTITLDQNILLMQSLYERIKIEIYSPYEKQKVMQFVKQYMQNTNSYFLSNSYDDFFSVEENNIHFYLPCLTTLKTWKRNLLLSIARYHLMQHVAIEKESSCEISLLLDQPYDPAIALCEKAGVLYKIIKDKI